MSTLRELAAESIGRITRRGLEPQLAQLEAALTPREPVLAVAPGKDATTGMVVAVTDAQVLVSSGAPFAQPRLDAIDRADVRAAAAEPDGDGWVLRVEHAQGQLDVPGMFDRDAQRIAGLLS